MPEEEKYWCPNCSKSSWDCTHFTIRIPHPLVLDGGVKNCKREGGCSVDVLVEEDMMLERIRQAKCPYCDPPNGDMLLYSYDPKTKKVCELTVVDGRLDIDLKRLLLLHYKRPETL